MSEGDDLNLAWSDDDSYDYEQHYRSGPLDFKFAAQDIVEKAKRLEQNQTIFLARGIGKAEFGVPHEDVAVGSDIEELMLAMDVSDDGSIADLEGVICDIVKEVDQETINVVKYGLPTSGAVGDSGFVMKKPLIKGNLADIGMTTEEYDTMMGKQTKGKEALDAEFEAMMGKYRDEDLGGMDDDDQYFDLLDDLEEDMFDLEDLKDYIDDKQIFDNKYKNGIVPFLGSYKDGEEISIGKTKTVKKEIIIDSIMAAVQRHEEESSEEFVDERKDIDQPRDAFDCETVLETCSNIYHRPSKVSLSSLKKNSAIDQSSMIKLGGKYSLPVKKNVFGRAL